MAGNTDRRIIQMQFDNRRFEKNIAKSTKSVEDLKKAMDFEEVTRGMRKFTEGTRNLAMAGFDKLTDNIQKLTDKFTGLGTLSELVLSQIRRGIEQVAARVSNFVSSMTTAQVSAGMEKYETLNRSVQTIKAATGESEEVVYKVLGRLNQYTDQTSYNFADMAQNIGKFTSVGIPLEAAERQMEGIANWAARSGAGINEASRAMYNLSQAMGVGKMTKIDWKSIENAGMATKEFKEQMIQAGLAAGTLVKKGEKIFTKNGNVEVNYKNIADTFSKGWATSGVISSTLERYYYDDLYYENGAAEAIITLSDTQQKEFDKMMASGKKLDASEWKTLQNMGVITDSNKEKIVELAVSQGKLTKEVKEDGTTIYKTVNKTGKKIEFTVDNIEESLSSGWFDEGLGTAATSVNNLAKESYEAAQKCLSFTDVLGAWKDQISTGWMKSFTLIFGELSEAMEFFSDVCNRVGESIGILIDFRNEVLEGWKNAGGRQSLLDIIIGNYGDNTSEGAYGFLDMLKGVGDIVKKGLTDFFYLFMDPVDRLKMKKDPDYIKKWMSGQLLRMTNGIKNFMKSIKDFLHEDITVNGKTTSRLEVIQNVVSGIAGALKLGYDIVTELISFVGSIGNELSPGFNEIIGFFGDLGKSIFNTADDMGKGQQIKQFFKGLLEDIKPLTDAINSLLTVFSDLLRTIFGLNKGTTKYSSAFLSIGEVIRKVAGIISKIAGPVIQFFADLFGIIRDLISGNLSFDNIAAIGERIKTAFSTMISGLPEPVKKVIAYVKTLYEAIKTLFTKGFTPQNLKNVGEILKKPFTKIIGLIPDTIKTKISEIVGKVKTAFGSLWEKIKQVFDNLFGKNKNSDDKNIIQKIVEPFTDSGKSAKDVVPGKNIFETIRDWIKEKFNTLITFIQNTVGNFGGTASSFGQKVSGLIEKLKQINLSKVLLWMLGGLGVGAFVLLIVKVFKAFKMFAKGISAIGDALKNGFSLKLKDSDKKIESFGDKMLKIAGAIAILTACIVVIGNMDAGEALRGIIYIITLLAALGLMSFALKKIYGDMDWKSGIAMFLGLVGVAVAVGMLTNSLVKISKLKPEEFQQSILGVAAIVAALCVVGELSKDGQFKFSNLSGLIALAASIAILVVSLSLIKNANPTQLAKMGGSLVAILTVLWVFMKLVNKHDLSMADSGMTQMIALAGAIAILILSLNTIKNAKPEQLIKMGVSLIAILGILWAFMKITSNLTMEGAGLVQLIALAGSIVLLVVAMLPLALLPLPRLIQAVVAVAVIMGAFAGFMALIDKKTMAGTSMAQFIALAGAIIVLVLAIIPLALLPLEKLAQAVIAVGVIILALAGFMILINRYDGGSLKGKGMVAFIAVAASIALLAWALMPLAALEPQQLLHFVGGMLSIMLGISLVIKMIKEMELKSAVGGLLTLLSLSFLILAFASALHDLKDTNFAIILAFSAGLALMCYGAAKAVEVLSKISPGKALKGILLLAALMVAVLGVISLMAPLVVGSVMDAIRDASASLVLIADMISMFSSNMGTANEEDMDKAGRVFDKVVDIVKKLAGMVFQAGNTFAFMDAMSSLTLAAKEIVKFDDKMKQVSNDGGADKAISIINKFKGMFENELAGFDAYMGRSSAFYDVMFKLGSAFDYFDSVTKNVVNPEDNQGFNLIKQLAACAPDLDTIYKMDLDKFKTQLAGLGGAMIVYAKGAESVEGYTIDDDTDVSGAVTLLRKISESLSENGGFTIPTNMPSDEQLTNFGVQLAALAGALVAFEEAGGKLGDGTAAAIKTLDFFKDLKTELASMPNMGTDINTAIDAFKGKNGEFVAKDELTVFAEDIAQLGSAMAHFASSTQVVDDKTGDVKPIDFSLAIGALDSIAELGKKLPTFGGLKEIIFGRRKTLGKLATEINLLGDAIDEFHKNTTTYDEVSKKTVPLDFGTETTGVLGFLNSIADIGNDLPKVKSFSLESLFTDKNMSFGELASQLVQLGSGLHTMSNSISGETDGKKNFDVKAMEDSTNLLSNQIIPLMTKMSIALPKVGGLGNFFKSLGEGRQFNLGDLGDQLGKLGEGLGTLGNNVNSEAWAKNNGVENAFAAMDAVLSMMIRIQKFEQEVGTYYNGFGAFNEFYTFMDHMSDPQFDIVGRISRFMMNIDEAIGGWASEKDMNDIISRMEAFKIFLEGINSIALNSGNAHTDKTSWSFIGEKFTNDIAQSIADGTESILTAITTLYGSVYAKAQNVEDVDWHQLGLNVATGIATGIDIGGEVYVWPSVERMMTEAYNRGKEAIDSNSPSKLFMTLGSFMGEGTAIGIQKSTDLVGENAAQMGEVALDNARDMFGLISRIMAEGTDTTPTIAPVLDMTNIDEGMAQFRESLSGYGIYLDGTYSALKAAHIGSSSYEDAEALKPDYTGIYNQMNKLDTTIQKMGEEIRKMKIVLDTGVLAGGVADILDEEYGRRGFYASRE